MLSARLLSRGIFVIRVKAVGCINSNTNCKTLFKVYRTIAMAASTYPSLPEQSIPVPIVSGTETSNLRSTLQSRVEA